MRSRLRRGWAARCRWVALALTLGVASGASADEMDAGVGASDFSRPGFYVGAMASVGFPAGWDGDFDNDLNGEASSLANASASAAAGPQRTIQPLSLAVDGAHFGDGLWGIDGLIGYRVAELLAFELEGEWLFGSSETDLDVGGSAPSTLNPSGTHLTTSTGMHRAEVSDLWTLTANVKVLPLSGRFQPFGLFGLGLQHSTVEADLVTSGLTTETVPAPLMPPVLVVPADFVLRSKKDTLGGALRAGIGLDVYATEHVAVQVKGDYVMPFSRSRVGDVRTDYFAIRWGLIYRF